VLDDQLPIESCRRLLDSIRGACAREAAVEVVRARRGRSLHYEVLDGPRVARDLPEVQSLYDELLPVAAELSALELVPLHDARAAANVNIISKRGEYRWHYDRNEVTVLVYLNDVEGGELECYPSYRLFLGNRWPRLQRLLDSLLATAVARRRFGRPVVVPPVRGRMVVMRGDRCLHSVRPLANGGLRVNLVFAYSAAGARVPRRDALDSYLYSQHDASADPNYVLSA